MDAVNTIATPTSYFSKEPTIQRSIQASQFQLGAVSSSQSFDLELMTKEGDKVTLSMDAQASALYAAFGEVTADDANGGSTQWGELSIGQFEREMTLTVKGDLNKAERREIRRILKTLNKMMKDFVQGKLEPMMANAGRLQDLQTIDSLQVSMAYESQVVVARQSQAAVAYNRTGEAMTQPAGSTGLTELPLKSESEFLAQDLAQTVASAKAPTDQLRELADEMLKAYRDQAARWNPLGGRVMDQIRNLFNAAMGA